MPKRRAPKRDTRPEFRSTKLTADHRPLYRAIQQHAKAAGYTSLGEFVRVAVLEKYARDRQGVPPTRTAAPLDAVQTVTDWYPELSNPEE